MPSLKPWRRSFWINGTWCEFVFIKTTALSAAWGARAGCSSRQIRQQDQPVVIIERDPANPHLIEARQTGCQVVIGDARDPIILQKAGLQRANGLVAVCGEDNTNAEVAAQARHQLTGSPNSPVTCTIHIEDPDLWVLLRELEMTTAEASPLRLEFFNVFENGAYLLAGAISTGEIGAASHPAGGGFSRLGQSLVVNPPAAGPTTTGPPGQRLTIRVVDPQAGRLLACPASPLPAHCGCAGPAPARDGLSIG